MFNLNCCNHNLKIISNNKKMIIPIKYNKFNYLNNLSTNISKMIIHLKNHNYLKDYKKFNKPHKINN